MKIRNCFVSNSSSASFVIPLSALSAEQYYKLLCYSDNSDRDSWMIDEIDSPTSLKGWTVMDNGDMGEFLESIGVDSTYVQPD